jgi:hypothetical protein
MPARVIRKNSKKSRSVRKSRTQKRRSMRGGDPGRVALPAAYFGGNMDRYVDGSSELASCSKQMAVSQGVIHPDGRWAGPNLYPMMGGGCGCGGRKMRNSSKKTRKHRKH